MCVAKSIIVKHTGHIRYFGIKGKSGTTSSFPMFQISKLRPAKDLRKAHLFLIRRPSGSPFVFHHVYTIDNDSKRIFPTLHMSKRFLTILLMKGCMYLSYRHRHIYRHFIALRHIKAIFFFIFEIFPNTRFYYYLILQYALLGTVN